MEVLYKYKSMNNLKRVLEMIRDNRLYAPTIDELNDAKEGAFVYPSGTSPTERAQFMRMLKNTHTCSLSRLKNNGHMFAIYGDSHKGCCIELSVTARKWEKVNVVYSDNIPHISSVDQSSLSEVLMVKSKQWGDEEEVRYFRYRGKDTVFTNYLSVRVHRVMFGVKVDKNDFELYKSAISGINKNVVVEHLREEDIDFGFSK